MASCSRIVGLVRRSSRLCNLTRTSITQFKGFRTTAIMSEEQIEELKKNPYYSKYADKIAKLQNTSPEEFLSRLSAHEDRKKAQESEANQKQRDFSFPGQAKKATDSASSKSLDKVVKLDLLKDKTPEEITEIWTKHFSQQEKICAVIPAETYKKMQQRFQEFNTFLFPIPRKNGYEFVMVQFQGNEAHFTTLINFQAHKENAPECLNMVHYTELMEEKGVVLMVGEYDKDTLGEGESNLLAIQTIQYYGGNNTKLTNHLHRFYYDLADFNHLDLIAQLESDFPQSVLPAGPA
eukprot:TRINITY_DN3818_c0_g1_i5.p1 TRINITY_DN3818_c0_g1~~TRINITY_DN3818_c0_g1_i5.p1  ORF type:complete len:293 (-),score=60.94 TRINITY_DN3818_c0_g1_i5:317-1195(-)